MADGKLSTSQKAALAKQKKELKAESIVFKEGDTSTELYLLLKGEFAVIKGTKTLVTVSEPMSYVGEMSYLLQEPRSATIKCVTDCEFMIVPGEKIDSLIDVSPAVGKKLIQTFATRLAAMNQDRLKLIKEVTEFKRRSQDQVGSSAQDYKRLLYAITLVYAQTKLPQIAEILKFGKDSSMLASHSVRLDVDDRHFACSDLVLKLHQQAKAGQK